MIIFLAPVIIFFWTVNRHTINIPLLDDYDAILLSLVNISEQNNVTGFIKALAAQHNEHRPAVLRIISLIQYQLYGSVDFKQLTLIGNLFLVGIMAVLVKASTVQFKPVVFLPVAFMLFQMSYNESIFLAMAALSGFPAILFAFSSIYFLTGNDRYSFRLACCFAVAAAFSQANGLFIFIAGIAGLLYQKKYTELAIWSSLFALVTVIYFYGYVNPAHPGIIDSVLNPAGFIFYFFLFSGSVATKQPIAFVLGFSLIAGICFALYKKLYKNNLTICLYILFLIITALSATAARSGFGHAQALSSRYAVISSLLVVLLYLSLIEIFPARLYKIAVVFSALTGFISINTYFDSMPVIKNRQERLMQSARISNGCYKNLFYPNINHASLVLDKADLKKIYSLPPPKDNLQTVSCTDAPELIIHLLSSTQYKPVISFQNGVVEEVYREDKTLRVRCRINLADTEKYKTIHFALPKQPLNQTIKTVERPDIVKSYNGLLLKNSGFEITLTFDTPESAGQAADGLCVAAESAITELTLLKSDNSQCRRLLKK